MDVFHDHDGVVHDDADGEDEAEHGEVVQRKTHHAHERERRDDARRDRDGGDERAAPVVQEKENRQRDEHRAEDEVDADFIQRPLDEARLVLWRAEIGRRRAPRPLDEGSGPLWHWQSTEIVDPSFRHSRAE